MKDTKAAGKLVDRIKSKLSSCKTVRLTASGDQAQEGDRRWRPEDQGHWVGPRSCLKSQRRVPPSIGSGSLPRDPRSTYTFLNPRGDYDFSNRQWNTVAVRAGERATKFNE